ncbi:MAG: NADH:flavin oxidoreductase [Chloroflexi bacterium]|nr:NADH:flavin oxidoreductase [Chloroflexota bacterium]
MTYPKVKRLNTPEAFRSYVDALGIAIPFDDEVDPQGALARPVEITDASAGVLSAPNRFAVLPMEGWDATTDGRPTELVRRRWGRFAESGCGLVWGEATAVRRDGRANPHQLVIDDSTVEDIAALRALLAPEQIAGMQLTHSGRWSRPEGVPAPRTAYQHPLLDARAGADATSVFSDGELDELVQQYVEAAVLARQAGFDFVDLKHCHGYLLHELLSARDRPGRYGGDLAGRTRFLRSVVAGIRDRAPDLAIAVRLSIFDLAPYSAGADGVGVPDARGMYPHAFGGDGTGSGIDLTETHQLLDIITDLGVGLLSTTAGSPYYNPHIQRPAYFPPSDGYQPPEDPLAGVARQVAATAELARRHPALTIVGSSYSYLQDWLPNVAQAVIAGGGASMAGLGRMILSYPHLAADVLAGRPLQTRTICRTFSDCTTAPRNGLVSGCYPLDPFYKGRAERAQLGSAKNEARARLR